MSAIGSGNVASTDYPHTDSRYPKAVTRSRAGLSDDDKRKIPGQLRALLRSRGTQRPVQTTPAAHARGSSLCLKAPSSTG